MRSPSLGSRAHVLIRLYEAREIFRGADFGDGHREEFFARITILIHRSIIDSQEGVRFAVENPQRIQILFKESPVLVFIPL